jgi:hypothetical protein
MKKRLKTLASILLFGALILLGVSCGNQESSNKETSTTEIQNVSKPETNEERTTPPENVEYCSTCGAEITGAPYEAFARKYCDMRCYADDPDM